MTAPTTDVAITLLAGDWPRALADYDPWCRRAALAGLRVGLGNDLSLPIDRLEISLVLADDATVRGLNEQYRGQDKPTNVLSFAALDDRMELPADGPILLGDVVLALETIVAEAEAGGMTLAHHVAHLVVHGILHLLGFDHAEDGEATEMEALESLTLGKLGVPDPYAADPPNGGRGSP
jgi:probable rRNA maturation factor